MDNFIFIKAKQFFLNNKYLIYAFLISFCIIFAFSLFNIPEVYYYDSGYYYYVLPETFCTENGFSFLNYPDTFRGYLLPFILMIFKKSGELFCNNQQIGFIFFNSLIIAFMLSFILIKTLNIRQTKSVIFKTLIITLIFIYFWPDFTSYPLSDIYALLFFGIVILCLRKLEKMMGLESTNLSYIFIMFVLGGSIYAAYNIRTVYMLPSFLILLFFLIQNYKRFKKDLGSVILTILLFSSGFFAVSLPQMRLNDKYNSSFTPKVVTEKFYENGLSVKQLYWGVMYPRYETNVESFCVDTVCNNDNNNALYPSAGVKFVDAEGVKLIQEIDNENVASLLLSIARHPVKYTKIYSRHLVNGLMPIFRYSYIKDMGENKVPAYIINCMILVLFLCVMLVKWKKILGVNIYNLFYFLVAFIAVPGAVECRFLLPAFLLIYAICFFYLDLDVFRKIWINKKLLTIAIVLSLFGIGYSYRVLDTTLNSTELNVSLEIYGN